MTQCAEDRFLRDTAEHEMQVLRDSGADRHIRFRKPGTFSYGFDLITWPGHLCVTGDCGTYVFKRVEDMFTFFRLESKLHAMYEGEKLYINPGYWGEKLLSIPRHRGYEEFTDEHFGERTRYTFSYLWNLYAIVWGIQKYDESKTVGLDQQTQAG